MHWLQPGSYISCDWHLAMLTGAGESERAPPGDDPPSTSGVGVPGLATQVWALVPRAFCGENAAGRVHVVTAAWAPRWGRRTIVGNGGQRR